MSNLQTYITWLHSINHNICVQGSLRFFYHVYYYSVWDTYFPGSMARHRWSIMKSMACHSPRSGRMQLGRRRERDKCWADTSHELNISSCLHHGGSTHPMMVQFWGNVADVATKLSQRGSGIPCCVGRCLFGDICTVLYGGCNQKRNWRGSNALPMLFTGDIWHSRFVRTIQVSSTFLPMIDIFSNRPRGRKRQQNHSTF